MSEDTMTKGYIFDYGGTLDTGGNHWGKVIWHAYQYLGVPVGEAIQKELIGLRDKFGLDYHFPFEDK